MLDPSNEYVEKVCLSLVREYVIRREYSGTLKTFNRETAPLIPNLGFYGSRLALGKDLGMEGLMKLNKGSARPLKSMLEVLVKCFLQDRELLLRSNFANSCYYSPHRHHHSRHHERRGRSSARRPSSRRQQEGRGAGAGQRRRETGGVIGSHSSPHLISSSHSPTHQESSFVSHPSHYHHQVREEEKKGKSAHSDFNPAEIGKGAKLRLPDRRIASALAEKRMDAEDQAREMNYNEAEDPMATFCRKLQEESRIMRNHSKTSLSLEQCQEDSVGDEYDGGDSWIPEDSKSHPQASASSTPTAAAADKRSNSVKTNERMNSAGDVKSRLTLGQNLLESKQNLLAQVSLSPEENEIRQQVKGESPPENSGSSLAPSKSAGTSPNKSKTSKLFQKSFSQSSSSSSASSTAKSTTTVTTDQGMKFRDADSLLTPTESLQGSRGGGGSKSKASELFFQKSAEDSRSLRSSVTKTLDMATWQELRATVLGERGVMQEGWLGQGFSFNYNIPFALVQKKGGPCGVLAAVQAIMLRNLMFGSAFCDPNELPLEGFDIEASPRASAGNSVTMKRSLALIGTLVEILWRCGGSVKVSAGEAGPGPHPHRTSVTIGLTPGGNGTFGPGSELRVFYDLDELKTFVEANLYRFDCVGLVYSVVLTRGIQSVQGDMDFSNSPLLGQHGYCTQELMNLLTMGRAISNAFDHEYVLDEKRLKGISSQADIGLLSLFEHYNSCSVGSFLKNPRFPLWIVCSESHFSLLFSADMGLTGGVPGGGGKMLMAEDESRRRSTFDLFYYDGLARQESIIKLTIHCGFGVGTTGMSSGSGTTLNQSNNNTIRGDAAVDDDLIPPLEKCIRTKWSGVVVDWNGTEPIL